MRARQYVVHLARRELVEASAVQPRFSISEDDAPPIAAKERIEACERKLCRDQTALSLLRLSQGEATSPTTVSGLRDMDSMPS